ncbi:DUF1826 domain-containing protein [Acuticoccus mangrovi]|uniref:DUF1826 domain-containing protein n=1 Tax=Acuticoccus mangrovi TaxID=2796142 RepID=A0A934MIM2_9HYPH|nr:DUF1826 domain-containing protein [Acuticoccus mangrovi]MBJ3778060.1 DUF1826 domain-containing protein [Acuticoccus mangrovi]
MRPEVAATMNVSDDPFVLGSVAEAGVALAVWQRKLPDALEAWLEALPAARFPTMRQRCSAAEVGGTVREACRRAKTPQCAEREAFIEAVSALARLAAEVMRSPLIELRLEVAEDQPCPKWHVDGVRCRLLSTLRGPATEFGPLGADGAPTSTYRPPAGAVALVRGRLWSEREPCAIVHRSPPIKAGVTRFFLSIDPVDEMQMS